MAATRLIAMHQNKGRSVAQCLKDRTDYAKNGEKTENGELISSYACDKETVDEEFLLAKQEYLRVTGRKPQGDIIAYQIRQSFKPGEITPEEANAIGYETVMRFTKGNHAFIVATHTDRAHIHNHIIFNSTNLACDRKFRDSWFIALVLQRVSDTICLEHALSVIQPRKPSERDNQNPYVRGPEGRTSFRKLLRENIDQLLQEKPKDIEEFLQQLQASGYEIKKGKHIAIRGTGQKRFIRLSSLGEDYTEDDIRKRISGEMKLDTELAESAETIVSAAEQNGREDDWQNLNMKDAGYQNKFGPRGKADQQNRSGRHGKSERGFDMLIDINRKMQEGKSKGYERWTKIYNVKQISKALLFLQEHGIRDYAELDHRASESAAKFHELSDAIKAKEARLEEIRDLKTSIINYAKTREVYAAYRKSGYSKKFFETNREEILLHKAAKASFDQLELKKLPKVKDLSAEYTQVLAEKRKLYEEYRAAKKEMMDYQIAKQDIDRFLKIDEEQHQKDKDKTKDQTR